MLSVVAALESYVAAPQVSCAAAPFYELETISFVTLAIIFAFTCSPITSSRISIQWFVINTTGNIDD